MKCYINTFYRFNNYGTKLQNYALVKTLDKYTQEVETIYLIDFQSTIKKLMKHIAVILPVMTAKQKEWKNEVKKSTKFKGFNKHLNYKKISYRRLSKMDFDNSIAIVGSDQVWSPMHLKNHKKDINLFFMNYIEKARRFTYAPSFGVSFIPNEMKSVYFENINKLSLISVREKNGKELLSEFTKKEVTVVPDPVFLLTRLEWSEISNINIVEKDYIFVYFLSSIEDALYNRIQEYARHHEYKIINVSGNNYSKDKTILSPDLFVKYIENSKCVFTDSFHAAAFSIIMEKPFQIFERNDVKQSSRIENLLDKFESNKCFIKRDDIEKGEIDIYPYYNKKSTEILEKERMFGLYYIYTVLEKGELINGKK